MAIRSRSTPEERYEYARQNPKLVAKRILGWDQDDAAMYRVIENIKDHMRAMLDVESLREFEDELQRLGWGRRQAR